MLKIRATIFLRTTPFIYYHLTMNHGDTSKGPGHKYNGMAIVAYLLFFVPLLTDAKDDPFVRFHVRQGFVVFLCAVAVSFFSFVLPLVAWVLHFAILFFVVLGIINVVHGKKKKLPLIGDIADHFKI